MATRTALTLATVLVPALRDAIDVHDAVVRFIDSSGVDHDGIWLGDRVLATPGFDLDTWGLGGYVAAAPDATGAEYAARLVLMAGPFSLALEYLGEPVDELPAPTPPDPIPADTERRAA